MLNVIRTSFAEKLIHIIYEMSYYFVGFTCCFSIGFCSSDHRS